MSVAVVRAVSSILSAVELLTTVTVSAGSAATAITATSGNASNARNSTASAAIAASPPPRAALYTELRGTLSSLASAMLKGAVTGEAASKALAEKVQLAVWLVTPAALRGTTFGAPRGSDAGSVTLPTGELELGDVAAAECSVTTLQIATHGAATGLSVATEYFAVTLSDHASLAPLAVRDVPEPISLLIPIDPAMVANPEPSPCNASEAAARLCSVCDATEATRGRSNCSGHGTCVHGRCWCDALYRGPACLHRLECTYWSESEQVWSSAGLSTDITSAAGAAALAVGLLRCESNHLTEFAGFLLPTSTDELLDELQELKLVLPCEGGFSGALEWEQNPLLYALLFGGSLLDLLSLPFFAWRYRRRLLRLHLAERRRFYGNRLRRSGWVQRALAKAPQKSRRRWLRQTRSLNSAHGASSGACGSSPRGANASRRPSAENYTPVVDAEAEPPAPPELRKLWSSELDLGGAGGQHGRQQSRVTPSCSGGMIDGGRGRRFSVRRLLRNVLFTPSASAPSTRSPSSPPPSPPVPPPFDAPAIPVAQPQAVDAAERRPGSAQQGPSMTLTAISRSSSEIDISSECNLGESSSPTEHAVAQHVEGCCLDGATRHTAALAFPGGKR